MRKCNATPGRRFTCHHSHAAFAKIKQKTKGKGETVILLIRSWGTLIALMGAMLIYGARKSAVRPLVLTVAGVSKAIFIALVLSHGGRFLGYQAGIAVVVDLVWVAVFATYLLALRRMSTADLKIGTTIGTL